MSAGLPAAAPAVAREAHLVGEPLAALRVQAEALPAGARELAQAAHPEAAQQQAVAPEEESEQEE